MTKIQHFEFEYNLFTLHILFSLYEKHLWCGKRTVQLFVHVLVQEKRTHNTRREERDSESERETHSA